MGKSSGGVRGSGRPGTKLKSYERSLEDQLKDLDQKGVQDFIHRTASNIRAYEEALKSDQYDKERKAQFKNYLEAEQKRMALINRLHFSSPTKKKQSNSTQVNALVKQNFQHYLNNRKERGAQLLKQLQDGIKALKSRNSSGNLDKAGQINLKASEILIKKVTRDFDSYSKRMKSYKEFAKKEKAIKRSTKGLPTGLRKAIVNQYLNGET